MTPPFDEANFPQGFADEEEPDADVETGDGDDLMPEEAALELDAEPLPVADVRRKNAGFDTAAGLVTAFYKEQNKRAFDGPPPRSRAVETGIVLDAYACPTCGETCRYTPMPSPYPSARMTVYTRPACPCEQERDRAQEAARAVAEEEARQARVKRALYEAAQGLKLPPALARCTFANFDGERHQSVKAALMEMMAFAEDAARFFAARRGTWETLPADVRAAGRPDPTCPPVGLIIVGPTGRGKSHICAAGCQYLVSFGVRAVFVNCGDWIELVRKQELAGAGTSDAFRAAQAADVLVLDDMGMEHFSANNPTWGQRTIYRLLNSRSGNALPTVGNTMIKPDRLVQHYGESGSAIISRLSVGPWLSIPASVKDGRSWGRTEVGASLSGKSE